LVRSAEHAALPLVLLPIDRCISLSKLNISQSINVPHFGSSKMYAYLLMNINVYCYYYNN